jgi:hypothetical protein
MVLPMNLGNFANVVAVVLSTAALVTSIIFARRQTSISHGANFLAILQSAFASLRMEFFIYAQEYVYRRMGRHAPGRGYRGLAPRVRIKVLAVSNFYNDLGKLVTHGALNEEAALASFGVSLAATWAILEPFIDAERKLTGLPFMVYFEDMACRARDRPPASIYRTLGLRRWRS